MNFLKIQKLSIKEIPHNTVRFLKHNPFYIVALIHIIIITIFCGLTVFKGNGHAVFIDVTEGTGLTDAANRVYYTYTDNWGEAIAEKQRIVPFTIMWQIYKSLNIGADDYIPFRILFGYILSVIGFVGAIKIVYETEHRRVKNYFKLFLAVFLATAIYLYNPWMTNRIIHNFLYFSSFTVPLSFAFAYRYFFGKSKRPWVWLLANGILLGTFTTTPHTILLTAIAVLPIIIVALIQKKYLAVLKFIGTVGVLAALFGAYWLLPFVLYKPSPDRVESLTIFHLLARNANPFETLKLQGYWWSYILPSYNPLNSQIANIITDVLYALPFAIFAMLLVFNRKNRLIQVLTIIFAFAFFLSTNTFLSSKMYEFIMFNEHTKFIGWMFREIEKFSYLIAFVYAYGIFLAINKSRKKWLTVLICVITIPVLAVYGFYLNAYTSKNLDKVNIPDDFNQMNRIFAGDQTEYNVAFFPEVQRMTWTDHIDSSNYISNLSSSKPSLSNVEGDSYTRYFIETILQSPDIDRMNVGRTLNTIGAKYVVIRKDAIGYDSSSLIESLDKQNSLKKVWEGDNLAIYDNNEYKGLLEIRNYKLATNLGMNVWPVLDFSEDVNSRNYMVEYLDNPFPENLDNNPSIPTAYILDNEGPMDLTMNNFKNDFVFPSDYVKVANPDSDWAMASLTNKTHAETDLYFQNYNITNRQFNYDHEVLLTLGGLKWPANQNQNFEKIDLNFNQKNGFNVNPSGNGVNINFNGEEKDDIWNIFSTEKFDVGSIRSIGFKGNIYTPEYLEPHFKFSYFDQEGKLLGIQAFYPKDKDIESVFKVPAGTSSVEFSIWTRGKYFGQNSFSIRNLSFYNMEDKYESPSVTVPVKTACTENCTLMARVLKSNNYPSVLGFNVNGETHNLVNTSLNSKYSWVKVADISSIPNGREDVIINDVEGFNSVAALAIVNVDDFNSKFGDITQKLESSKIEPIFEDKIAVYTDSKADMSFAAGRNALDKYVHYSPVKYAFDITRLPTAAYLIFKKPYKPAWQIACGGNSPKQAINSFTDIFVIENTGTCVVDYSPQGLYVSGLYISGITAILALLGTTIVFSPLFKHKFASGNPE